MMKVYAIKMGDVYLSKHKKDSYPSNVLPMTSDLKDASHYFKEHVAKSVITRKKNEIDIRAKYYFRSSGHWAAQNLKFYKKFQGFIDLAEVIELDVEEHNVNHKSMVANNTKFNNNTVDNCVTEVIKDGNGYSYCKKCGVHLKKLSYVKISNNYSMNICAFCLSELGDMGKDLLNDMDQEFKNKIERDRFVKRI